MQDILITILLSVWLGSIAGFVFGRWYEGKYLTNLLDNLRHSYEWQLKELRDALNKKGF